MHCVLTLGARIPMNQTWFRSSLAAVFLVFACLASAAPASLRVLTQHHYLPGLPLLVRVEAYDANGARDRETWDTDATLTVDQPGVTLSTNRITLRNGLGSALVTFTGGGDFNLTATVGSVQATRPFRSVAGQPVTRVGGLISGGSSTWSGIIHITNDVTITNHTLTIQSNTLVLIDGVTSGTTAPDIFVNANANIQSLGTEAHPVVITCSNASMNARWGQIRHNNSQPSLYRNTFISRAGRAAGEGHTGQAPVFRPFNTTLTFESSSITDLSVQEAGAVGYGGPGKVMYAINSALTFRDCLLSRARMGPEIQGTSLLFTNSYILEMRGPDDSDGIYLHDQQAGQQLRLSYCVMGYGDDDGIDTLNSIVTVEDCIVRNWPNPNEDAKGISAFNGQVTVNRSIFVDCWVGVSAKANAGSSATMHINNSTIVGLSNSVAANLKNNAPGPVIDIRMTNCVVGGVDPFKTDFGQTNITVRYTIAPESWPGTGNITADPQFVNAAAGDYRLRPTSPAINAGNPASPADADGTVADMGVYAFLFNPSPLIGIGSTWRYLDNGTDQGSAWAGRLFNDSAWASGQGQFGYGDGDEATVVADNAQPGYTPGATDRYITTYFRRAFTVLNPSQFTNVEARLLVDDGAIVYLNGQELFRFNLPASGVNFQTVALQPVEPHALVTNVFSPTLLVTGTNVIAVEVHQQSASSSDLSFDFELVGLSASTNGGVVPNSPPSVAVVAPFDGEVFTAPASIDLAANPVDNDGSVTSVEFFQNGQTLGQVTSAPYTMNWNSVPVGSYSIVAVATDNAGARGTSAPVNITVSEPAESVTNVVVFSWGNWRYLDTGTNLGATWSARTFDDSGWSNGFAPLGYQSPQNPPYVINTTVGFGGNASQKYITTYFRTPFLVEDPSRVEGFILTLLRDDGAVAYINGVEVFRVSMPAGPIAYDTLATTANNYGYVQSVLPAGVLSSLVAGTNVLAVEIHQGTLSSSDIVLDAMLEMISSGATNDRPTIAITSPVNGATYGAPFTTTITADANDTDGSVTNVAFFVNGSKLADDTTAPFSAAWNSVPAGTYSLFAVATDNVGLVTTSAVVNVTVSANTAPPTVASKTPAPGSVTNLTQIAVTFSKPVVGVNAADFLVNGVAATGVSGSGSNYTFTFAQPSFGTVNITWAAGHGITDTFTPPAAFNANGAGATWSYQLLDSAAPTLASVNPTPGSTVAALTSIAVTFSEAVTGVNASDLLINSSPAAGLSGSGAGPYTFTFAQPPQGTVQVAWSASHGIADTSGNPFSPAPWSYVVDTNSSGILISEIMYHPSSENVREEYIELFNKGGSAVNLNGWKFSAGVSFTFSNVSIPAGGYLVVAADLATFTAKYPTVTNVVGNWTGTLNNDAENIELQDNAGRRVNRVSYGDEGDWAQRQRGINENGFRGWLWFKPHDGAGASLELVNLNLSNESGQNWRPSGVTNGTPGRVNSVIQNNVAPLILSAGHQPIVPRSSEPVVVSARIVDETTSGLGVSLSWRVSSATPPAFAVLPMTDDGANGDAVANDGLFSARIPAQANNAVVEWFITAVDAQNNTRTWPAPAIASFDGAGPTGQVVNALFQVDDTTYAPTNAQPMYKIVMTEAERAELANIPNASSLDGPNSQMNATFISIDGSGVSLHYNVGVRNRGHGSRRANPPNYRVNFRSDDPWNDLKALNLNSVAPFLQHIGSIMSRKAGAVSGNAIAVQLRVNNVNRAGSGSPMFGSYAAVEVINGDFASTHFPNNDGGNVYKVVRDIQPPNFNYRGTNFSAYTNTYFKESNVSENDFSDLVAMLDVMGENSGANFTPENVRRVVDPEQWLRHLAVMNIFANSESGLNTGNNDDYYMYRGTTDPRFLLVGHDLDSIFTAGLGNTIDIFRATCCPISGDSEGSWRAMDRFMRSPDFQPLYYQILLDLVNGPFSAAQFSATADQVLGGYVPQATIDSLKTWLAGRRASILSQIPAFTLSNAPVAVVSGTPRSPTPFTSTTLTVGGSGVTSYAVSVNGGAYSAETPVATTINLSSLANGTNRVSVIAKSTNGVWQSISNATVVTWVVNTSIPAVRINEVLARNVSAHNHQGTFPDLIELYNEGNIAADLSGLRLTDDPANPNKFTFPNGTMLAAGAYLTVYANNADGTPGFHTGFSLGADGDGVFLFHRVSNGGALLDSVEFGRQLDNFAIGRFGTSGEWRLAQPSFNAVNVAQALGNERNLRLNEWLASSLSQPDFIELYNPESLPVALGGLSLSDALNDATTRNVLDPLNFIGAGEFLVFTADGDGNGRTELDFKLGVEQGEIALFARDGSVIDCVIYGPQQPEVAQGRCPNGGVNIRTLEAATPGAPNSCPFTPPPPVTVTLLTLTNNWSYDATGADLGTAWRDVAYNDSGWLQGRGVFGFDNGNNFLVQSLTNTVLPLTSAGSPIVTYYFRTQFSVAPGVSPTSLIFTNLMDDGVIVYLNGLEVYRLNMPAGPVNAATPASSNTESLDFTEVSIGLTNGWLINGVNLLAVELHQGNTSDVNMGLAVSAVFVTNSPAAAGVVINEVLANNTSIEDVDGSTPDWVEIFNPSSTAVDLGDMSLTDSTTTPRRWVFPAGTILSAQSYLRVRLNPDLPSSSTNTGFGLSAAGGSVYLFNRPADGSSLASSVTYGLQAGDFSIGRVPNGSTNWVLTVPSFGSANIAAALGDASLLKLNEWMADPASGDDYFEVYNPNAQPVDVSRFYVTDDLSNRTKHRLPALSFIGVGQNAFQRFVASGNTTLGGEHVNFSLRAAGEALGLTTASNVALDSVSFGPQTTGVSQGRLPDGSGSIVNFTTTPTPGRSNFLPLSNVVVNEVIAHTDAPLEDAVEFHNVTGDDVDISGWYLSDSQNNLLKWRVPPGTVIPAGGFVVFYEYQFNGETAAERFSLSSAKGDDIYLSQSTNAGTVTGYRAFASFGASENGVSFGRFVTSAGADFTAMSARTFGVDNPVTTNQFRTGTGRTNVYPKVGPVVINELMYNPNSTNDALEFLELRNITGSPVPLFDPAIPQNTWRLRRGIDFNFPPSVTIPAGGYVVVVSFDPATAPTQRAAFEAVYGTNATLVGPYSGKLDNAGEPVELQKPDAPQTIPGPDFGLVPYIVVDRVVYSDRAPWPSSPDGLGDALKRVDSALYGNEPLNWLGGAATPGAANFAAATNRPPVLTAIANRSVHRGYTVAFTASASDPDMPGQSLTYSLLAGAPAGATINATNGQFRWVTATNTALGTYNVTVRVTDNGSPALSDSKAFQITVLNLPQVRSVTVSNNFLNLGFESHPGRRYRLESTASLTAPNWQQVGADFTASGTSSAFSVVRGVEPHRFYRIVSLDN
jgi:hypothetical protein